MYSYPVNITGFAGLATYVNSVTGNLFWSVIVMTTFLVLLIAFMSMGIPLSDGLLAASFVGFILAVFTRLFGSGLIHNSIIFLMLIIMVIGFIKAYTATHPS